MGPVRIGLMIAALLALGGATAAIAAPGSAAGSGCAAGPTTVGDTIVGTPCDDTIVAPAQVEVVRGGGGDDTIVAAPSAASAPCPAGCHLGVGSQTFDGGPGDDVVYGERGNDTLNGGEGDDRLYGGIGDDRLRGGPGTDRLSGGFGADSLDGEAGDDFVRGDATLDKIFDSGGGGIDTLSYATGVTPGFSNDPKKGYPTFSDYTNFPDVGEERGAYIDLTKGIGDNGVAPDGGGLDGAVDGEVTGTDFEQVIGTPFSDFIVGSSGGETIYGGGGGDVILGEGGNDVLHGGADGDHLDGGSGQDTIDGGVGIDSCAGFEPTNPCELSGNGVELRDSGKVAVGLIAPEEGGPTGLYLAGSNGDDDVTATYAGGSPAPVTFSLVGGNFDSNSSAAGGCAPPASGKVVCQLSQAPDSVVLAGMAGNDVLSVVGFPDSTSIVALGGDGGDSLSGGAENEDGGRGSDLFLSDSICDGDLLNGGEGDYRDNASWTKLEEPVAARLDVGLAGRPVNGQPSCSAGGSLDQLQTIEDLEGTGQGDFFYGDAGQNQLLGHLGADSYFALDGEDTILANSADSDLVIDCGGGSDTAFVDHPTEKYADPTPIGCETVFEADPNSFRPPDAPSGPQAQGIEPPKAPLPPRARPPDATPPQTKLLHRPGRAVLAAGRRRSVSFAFASTEPGGSFRCRLDHSRFKPCRSPRRYRLTPGGHTFAVFAIDQAGNRDRSPALFRFRVRRR